MAEPEHMKNFNQFDSGCEPTGWSLGASAVGNAVLITTREQTNPNQIEQQHNARS
jgi:hypothetical protein